MPRGVLDPSTPRCVAHRSTNGERCKNAAIKGGTVCRRHGGAAPQVKRAARERFNDLIDPMINIAHNLAKEAEDGKLSASDRIAFMKFVADRTGFMPGKTVNIDGPAPWEVTFSHIIREVPADLAELDGTVIDADVIEEDEDALARHDREEEAKRAAASRDDERARARGALPNLTDRRVGSADPPRRDREVSW